MSTHTHDAARCFDQVQLSTERLLLRPLRAIDAAAVLAIRSDEVVMRYHTTPPWKSIELADALIARDLDALRAGDYLRLGMERLEDQALIGTCGLFHFDGQSRRAEIGYELHREAWGKGYMHEALTALLDYGFCELGFNRVEGDVHPDNTGSNKSLERLGFQKEGYLRERWIVGDEVSDSVFYGLLFRDWTSKAGISTQS